MVMFKGRSEALKAGRRHSMNEWPKLVSRKGTADVQQWVLEAATASAGVNQSWKFECASMNARF